MTKGQENQPQGRAPQGRTPKRRAPKETPGQGSRRCFLALELPGGVREELLRIQGELRRRGMVKARWIPEENLHITLKFLGDVPAEGLPAVVSRLQGLAEGAGIEGVPGALPLRLGSLGVFDPRRVRVLWAGLEEEDPVRTLQAAVDRELEGLFPREKRFHPHITLARVKRVYQRRDFLRVLEDTVLEPAEGTVSRLLLKESRLNPGGAEHRVLGEWPWSAGRF